jgi:uncharacterized peroxidase-related enzyme
MSRISIPTVETSPDRSKPLLAAVQKQLGMTPNLMKLVGHSPAGLEGYLSLSGALAKGELGAALRERIAIGVAEFNGCDYCLSAHHYIGRNLAKLSDDDVNGARDFRADDAKDDAALRFARRVLETRGRVADKDLEGVRAAGYGEAEVVEIVAAVALNVLTNYVNNVAQTDIDFPEVVSRHGA